MKPCEAPDSLRLRRQGSNYQKVQAAAAAGRAMRSAFAPQAGCF